MFVGRDEELARLTSALDDACAARGRIFVVSGEPGIGKTRLADELAARAGERGVRVAWGRCWEAGGAPAFWPWIQALREIVGDELLASALPELGADATTLAADPQQARFRLFDAATKLLARAASKDAIVLVLDDLHAADAPSLLLLQFVARALRSMRVLVIATFRDVEARMIAETGELLAKIARDAERISLARLSEASVAEWMRATPCADAAAEVHRVTEGNPLFIDEIFRTACARRSAITSRICRRRRAISWRARRFSGAISRRATWRRRARAISRQRRRRSRRRRSSGSCRRAGRASHSRTRSSVRSSIAASRSPNASAHVHHRRGLAKESADVRAAHHLIEGVAAGDRDVLIDTVRVAAERATAMLAFEDAARLLERALAAVESSPVSAARTCELCLLLGEARIFAGEDARGKEACVRAAAIAKERGDAELIARAALVYGTEILPIKRDETMVDLLRVALAALPESDSPLRARVLARLGAALIPSPLPTDREPRELAKVMEGRFADADQLVAEVRAIFERLDGAQLNYLTIHLFGTEHARRDRGRCSIRKRRKRTRAASRISATRSKRRPTSAIARASIALAASSTPSPPSSRAPSASAVAIAKPRRSPSARINVQRRIRDAVERLREQDAALGRTLDAAIKTGIYCSYAPPWSGRDG